MADERKAPRPLDEIAADMEALRTNGDTEAAHGIADDLLIEALRSFKRGRRAPDTAAQVDRLVAAFDALDKWYA